MFNILMQHSILKERWDQVERDRIAIVQNVRCYWTNYQNGLRCSLEDGSLSHN